MTLYRVDTHFTLLGYTVLYCCEGYDRPLLNTLRLSFSTFHVSLTNDFNNDMFFVI